MRNSCKKSSIKYGNGIKIFNGMITWLIERYLTLAKNRGMNRI